MKTKYLYICLSGFLFAYFFAQAMSISLLAIWLKSVLHLTGAQAGMVFSANFFAAMCAQPVYGFLSDKAGLNKSVLRTIALLVLLCGFFFAFVYQPLLAVHAVAGAIVGGFYLGITFIAGSFAIESYVDRAGRKYGFEFSRVRLWGSLGFAAAAFFSGTLFNMDPRINFFLASLAGFFMLLGASSLLILAQALSDWSFDLPWLARQFRFSGGSIRNVALAAAFLAAEQGQAVAMRHLMLATKRELQKMGRLVNDQEYRKHG